MWIVGTVVAVWFGSQCSSSTQLIVAGERLLCAVFMAICSFAAGCLSLGFSQGFDGSQIWDWLAMSTLATAVILLTLTLGESAIVGASIGNAFAIMGGGIVGVAIPHRPAFYKRHSHLG